MGNVVSVVCGPEFLTCLDSLKREIGLMKLDPWSIIGALVLGALLKVFHRLIRDWCRNRKASPAPTAESKRESIPFVITSVIALTVAFGALLLVIVNAQQTSQSSRALSMLAAGVAALVLFNVLALVIGVPAYNFTTNLKEKHLGLEEEVQTLRQKNEHLTERVNALEARNKAEALAPLVPKRKSWVKRQNSPPEDEAAKSKRRSNKAANDKKE